MKTSLLLIVFSVGLLAGCTAYKAGQTPDDVYYSPAKEIVPDGQREYEDYVSSNDDRYLRMKTQNNQLWSSLDDYSYWYDSRYYNNYYYGYYGGLYLPVNYLYNPYLLSPYLGGGYYYNPVYIVGSYKNPSIANGTTSGANITAYKNRSYTAGTTNGFFNFLKPGSSSNSGSWSNTNNGYRQTYYSAPAYNNSSNSNNNNWSNPVRVSSGTTSSSAGGASGGFHSTGTSTSSGRTPRG
jgi:hypothetical protein